MNIRQNRHVTMAAGVCLIALSAWADGPSLDDRLNQMQQDIESLRNQNRVLQEENRELKQRLDELFKQRPAGMSDEEFRTKVNQVLKDQPAQTGGLVLPLGKETVLKLGGYFQANAELGDVDAWNGRLPSAGSAGNKGND